MGSLTTYLNELNLEKEENFERFSYTFFPIDLVYTWVNSNDKIWQEKKNQYQKLNIKYDKDSISDCRFLDNEELKYSLRSVEMNAPWINKIYIITDNQKPDWLNIKHPKIKIIDHKEILPNDKLPLFNSTAIEVGIPNIPSLSEYFLYANDDMFFWNKTKPEFFFKRELPIFRVGKRLKNKKYTHLFGYMINNAHQKVKEKFGFKAPYFPHHGIDSYKKSIFLECINEFQEDFNKTLDHRFRDCEDLQRMIVLYYSLYKKQGYIKKIFNNLIFSILGLQDSDYCDVKNIGLKKYSKAKIMCFNDSRKTSNKDRLRMKEILNEKFPFKSNFEK